MINPSIAILKITFQMGLIGLKIPCRDLPGKDFFLFYIAPLNPVLKDEAFGEQAGQAFA